MLRLSRNQGQRFISVRSRCSGDGAHFFDTMTGLLARLTGILAQREAPIFVVCTFDTEYTLIANEFVANAVEGFEMQDIEVEAI